jgi:peptide/nickel transport system substrate-binding protein
VRYRTKMAAGLCAMSLFGLLVAACGSSASSPSSSSSSATLTMESSPSGPITRDFNPFSPTSAANILGSTAMIYEPLLQFDLLKPGTTYPWLATSYAWSNGGKTITFQIRSGVKYSNGTPFTAADVAWEFNLEKKFPTTNVWGLPITSASSSGSTAVINFSAAAYSLLYYIAGETYMVDPSVYGKAANPFTYPDPNPIGTGPYVLSTFSSSGITLTRNPHYWQAGEPKVAKLDFPAYDSNTTANLDLEQGTLDWGGNFVSDIKSAYVAKDPSTNHYWDAPLQTEAIIPNLDKFPFNNLAVREAVAVGVNRTVISDDGEDYQQPPAVGPGTLTGLTLPIDSSYLTPQTETYATTYNTAEAKKILEAAGWKMGSNGYFVSPSGQTLAFTFTDAAPYTDFLTDDQIMASELKAAGMDVTVSAVSVTDWTTDLGDGNFQAIAHWGTSGPSPYYLFYNWLDTALAKPIGQVATGDYERFDSPQADAYLASFSGTDNTATQKADMVGLEKIVATQLPVIPLFYGVAWDEYNTSKFTGWPTASNEYAPGEPSQPFNELTVLRLRPVS